MFCTLFPPSSSTPLPPSPSFTPLHPLSSSTPLPPPPPLFLLLLLQVRTASSTCFQFNFTYFTVHRSTVHLDTSILLQVSSRPQYSTSYGITGNFQGWKLSRISRFCGYLRRFSLRNLGAWASFGATKVSNLQKFSPWKLCSSPIQLDHCVLQQYFSMPKI